MIVVAIGLLAAIAVPDYLRSRKRAQATRVLEDLRLIDAALDQYAMEHQRSPGDSVPWEALQTYLKTGSPLYSSLHLDLLGNDFGATFTVDLPPNVPTASRTALSDVTTDSFWSPFIGLAVTPRGKPSRLPRAREPRRIALPLARRHHQNRVRGRAEHPASQGRASRARGQ